MRKPGITRSLLIAMSAIHERDTNTIAFLHEELRTIQLKAAAGRSQYANLGMAAFLEEIDNICMEALVRTGGAK